MERYRCPNATYEISRAVHLARLAAFDAACRACPHRHEAALLPPSVRRTWQKLQAASRGCGPASCDGAVFGTLHNEISPAVVRQYAWAWGHYILARQVREVGDTAAPADHACRSQVALAGDGRPEAAALLAAACEGLRMAGCHVLELGTGTAPLAAALAAQRAGAGAIFVGNPPGLPHTAGLCLWGPGGTPAADAELSAALAQATQPMRHRGGRWQAVPAAEAYLARLRGFCHGLRPLRFVVQSTCRPWLRWIEDLMRHTGCTVLCDQPQLECSWIEADAREIAWRRPSPQPRNAGNTAMYVAHEDARAPAVHEPLAPRGSHVAQEPGAAMAASNLSNAPPLAPHAKALAALRRRLLESGAHFGMWCDGDGRRCYVLDEHGRLASPERLLVLLAGLLAAWLADSSPPAVVVEQTCDVQTTEQLASLGLRVHRAAAGQNSIWQAMLEHGAPLGGGPSGCLWLALDVLADVAVSAVLEGRAGPYVPTSTSARAGAVAAAGPQLDALAVLTLWLHVLSRQNLPASGVLEQPLRALAGFAAGSRGCGTNTLQQNHP